MKRFIQLATLVIVLAASIPAAGATEKKCTGDAARAKPPVPNYLSHIRNVVWRNTRTLCQSQVFTADFNKAESSNTEATPSSVQTQLQKR